MTGSSGIYMLRMGATHGCWQAAVLLPACRLSGSGNELDGRRHPRPVEYTAPAFAEAATKFLFSEARPSRIATEIFDRELPRASVASTSPSESAGSSTLRALWHGGISRRQLCQGQAVHFTHHHDVHANTVRAAYLLMWDAKRS